MKQQRRADVVRQVADDAQPRSERREVESECIGDVQLETVGLKTFPQPRREIAVDLDRRDAAGARDERVGQRGESRAYLDDVVAGLRIDRLDDSPGVVRVGKKMLAEALARRVSVHQWGQSCKSQR